jgi:lipopolysaccharide transport system permease protein
MGEETVRRMSINTPEIQAYESGTGSFLTRSLEFCREAARELVRYRELLFMLAWRDIKARYKHSLVGIGWAVFVPVVMMVVFGTVLRRVATIDTGHIPYPIFLYCGLVPWQFFQQSVIRATQSLVGNRNLVTKIFFAREVLPLAAILTAAFDFIVASTVLAGMMVWYKIVPTWTIVFVPLVLAIQLAFSAGVALVLSMTNLFYRDVGQAISVMMTAWMFATAVVYPLENSGWWRLLNTLNPMTPIITSYRDLILKGSLPDWSSLGTAAGVSAALLVTAWVAFHHNEFRFAENV